MYKLANINGLIKAARDLIHQAPGQLPNASAYRYADNPAAEYGYHMGTQGGNMALADENFIYDAMKQGVPYREAIRQLAAGRGSYQGYNPTATVTGNKFGVTIRNGRNGPAVNPNNDVINYKAKQFRQQRKREMLQASAKERQANQQANAEADTFAKNNGLDFSGILNGKSGQVNPTDPNSTGGIDKQRLNNSSPAGLTAQQRTQLRQESRDYKKKLRAQGPQTRIQYTGPTKDYASTATTYNGGKMGMTVDPIKTRQNMKNMAPPTIKRQPSGRTTVSYKGKHGGSTGVVQNGALVFHC